MSQNDDAKTGAIYLRNRSRKVRIIRITSFLDHLEGCWALAGILYYKTGILRF